MQVHSHQSGGKHFLEQDWVVRAHQEDMLVHKAASWLLGHLKCFELLAVDKFELGMDGFVFGLSFERNVLGGDQVNLERVELLGEEFGQQWLLRLDPNAHVVQLLRLQLVKSPVEIYLVFWEKKAR